ncbi:MAG: MATE family efflux transporter [Oscillospiraceae bacterium]
MTNLTSESKNSNLGTAPIGKLLVRLAVPAIMAQLINALYNIVDRIYIGRLPEVGKLALAGLGISFPIIMIISAFAALIGMGGAPLAAIKMGENNPDHAEKILGNCFIALIGISVVLTAFFFAFKEPLLYSFGASEKTFAYADQYLSVYLIGTLFVQISLGLNQFITTQGFASTAMKTVLIGAVLNIVLDPIFIYGFHMGVTGAALATILSQMVSAIWVLWFLFGKKTLLRIKKTNFKWSNSIMLPVLALGLSPFIMQSTESLVQLTFTAGMQKYGGDDYVGAIAIIISCMQVVLMPIMGLTQGAQPILSYNYGAKKFDRVRKCFKMMFFSAMVLSLAVWGFVMLFPQTLIYLFNDDPALLDIGVYGVRIFMFGLIIMFVQHSCQAAFVALGQAKISMFLALLRKIILLVPIAMILPSIFEATGFMGLVGTDGLFYAEPIADILASVTTGIIFLFYSKKILKSVSDSESNA